MENAKSPIAMNKLTVNPWNSPATNGLIDMPSIYKASEYPMREDADSGSADRAYATFKMKCRRLSEARPSKTRPDRAMYILRD